MLSAWLVVSMTVRYMLFFWASTSKVVASPSRIAVASVRTGKWLRQGANKPTWTRSM